MQQRTLKTPCAFEGIGLHSGHTVRMLIEPATADTGITFQRTDIPNAPCIKALATSVFTTQLSTTLGQQPTDVSTIEHIMASLWACGIDNALVKISAPEIPIMDGSAGLFMDTLVNAGTTEVGGKRRHARLRSPVTIRRGTSVIIAEPASAPVIDNLVEYPVPCIGRQTLRQEMTPKTFSSICDARTFCLQRDVDLMRANGLAKGGSLDNAVVASEDGILNPDGLRYPDEAVRHKTLDALGDFALLGMPLVAHIRMEFGGHALHVALIKELLERRDALLEIIETASSDVWARPFNATQWPSQAIRLKQITN